MWNPERNVTKPSLTSLRNARRAPRFPTKLEAILRVGRRRMPITIGDISRTGAMISGRHLPPCGERVALLAEGLEVLATVVWREDESCGLDFHDAVDPLAVVRQNLAQFAWLKQRRTDPPESAVA
jgi:hypothetical protein